MDYLSGIWLVCAASVGLFLGISQIASGDEPTLAPVAANAVAATPSQTSLLPEKGQYLIELCLYQEESSTAVQDAKATETSSTLVGGVPKALGAESTKDEKKILKVLARPHLMVLEKSEARCEIGNQLDIGDGKFDFVGTRCVVYPKRGDNGTIQVKFTLEYTTMQPQEGNTTAGAVEGNVGVRNCTQILGVIDVKPGKTVKVCNFVSEDSKRMSWELTVNESHPEPTAATQPH